MLLSKAYIFRFDLSQRTLLSNQNSDALADCDLFKCIKVSNSEFKTLIHLTYQKMGSKAPS